MHLFIISRSSHFFNKTDFEQYLLKVFRHNDSYCSIIIYIPVHLIITFLNSVSVEVQFSIPPLPRFCELERLPTGFGFTLWVRHGPRPGQYINNVVPGGAASIAGIRNGNILIPNEQF